MAHTDTRKLGLIGLGSFGRLVAEHLRDHFAIVAADELDRSATAAQLHIDWGPIQEAAACPYVVLAVPVQDLSAALEAMRDHVQPGALVIDVGSVKLVPVQEMLRLLPDEVEILGTHPMFGPQSAGGGLRGHRIVLCPVRTERLDKARAFLEELGLEVIVCDAETHDRDIAQTQALAQFVGRALAQLEKSESPIRTPAYTLFREVAKTVGEDTWELFTAIQNLNPHAADMRAELMRHLQDIQSRLAEEPAAATDAAEPVVPGRADRPTAPDTSAHRTPPLADD